MRSSSLLLCAALLMVALFVCTLHQAEADPIMEHAAHLNEDGSLLEVEGNEHLMKRFKRQWGRGGGGGGGGGGRHGGCCDCCDGSCGCITCCYYSSGK